MEIHEIRDKLKYGDYSEIAKLIGCGVSTVHMHFNKDGRNTNTPTGDRITKTAIKLLEFREQFSNENQKKAS